VCPPPPRSRARQHPAGKRLWCGTGKVSSLPPGKTPQNRRGSGQETRYQISNSINPRPGTASRGSPISGDPEFKRFYNQSESVTRARNSLKETTVEHAETPFFRALQEENDYFRIPDQPPESEIPLAPSQIRWFVQSKIEIKGLVDSDAVLSYSSVPRFFLDFFCIECPAVSRNSMLVL
jgi:hypothetical protein